MLSSATDVKWDERTSAGNSLLDDNESMFRQLFERSADAIFLFDPGKEVFVDCNQAAVAMMRASSKKELLMVHPANLSSEFQPDGKSSREKTSEVIELAVSKGSYRFEWRARRMDQTEFPLEVLLTPIQTGEYPLMATVCRDITDRKSDERKILELNASLEQRVAQRTAALRESEEKFRALFEGSSQGVVLHDENQILEVNPAAVRIMGCRSVNDLIGKHPADTSPPFQPNGESSALLARKHIEACMANGSARFDWVSHTPQGKEILLEVTLTRIEWSERQIIQALIHDISERKKAEAELRAGEARLRESEARFSAAFHSSPIMTGITRASDGGFVLVNDAALNWVGCSREEVIGRTSLELGLWEDPAERARFWEFLKESGSTQPWECQLKNRHGKRSTMLASGVRIEISGEDHLLVMMVDISERKKAEAELRASEARLRESEARFSAAFHASPALIGILRVSDGKYVLANDAHLNWLGYSREEVLGRSCLELGMWENSDERDLLLKDMHAFGSVRQRECRWRNRRGERFTVLLSAETIKLNDTPHMLLMALDITKRKGVEEELRASEARLRESEARFSAAFRASPVFITISRMDDGRYILANEAFLKWTEYRLDEVLARNSEELSLWANPADREPFWEELRRTGSIRERECRTRNRHGKLFTMLVSADIIKIDGMPHLLTVGADITERKQTEAELRASEARLRESEARFSVAFHSSPIITGICRASDATFVLVNEESLNWSGYDRDEVIGRTSIDLGVWENPAERQRLWDDVRRSGLVRAREVRLRNRFGKVSTMLASGAMIVINGEDHLLVMMVEISHRKQAEAELHRTLAREKELSELKSNFVSMVSHEFRTPLGIIQSSAELLRDFYKRMQPVERHEQLESITRNTRRMAGMMEEVLVLSRLDAGKLEFEPAVLDLNVFFHRVVDEVLSATNRRCPIELSLKFIPSGAKADERLLSHVFTNLLSNAVKYSEPGETVHFAVERDGDEAVCVVCDRGIGISEEDQEQLFTAFHRGSNVGTRAGTGLGLLLVKRCADLHGGKVQINSKIGAGTTVTVRFPIF